MAISEDSFSNSTFKTFVEAKNEVEKYCKNNFHPIRFGFKETFGCYNKTILLEENKCHDFPDNEIRRCGWICKHFGNYKTKSIVAGQRKRRTYSSNCKMGFNLSYDRASKTYVFTKTVFDHNHPHGKSVYEDYSEQRIPQGELRIKVINLLAQGVSPKLVLEGLNSCGLRTKPRDIYNLIKYCKQQADCIKNTENVSCEGTSMDTTSPNKKAKVNKKITENSNKKQKRNKKITKNHNQTSKEFPQNDDDDEDYESFRHGSDYEDGCQYREEVREVNTHRIGDKRMKENKIETEIINGNKIKKRKTKSSGNSFNQHNGSPIKKSNMFENRKSLFNVAKLETETHKEYRTRFEKLYEKSRIEEMSKEQLKCFHFTKAYKESEDEDYLRKMTEKMSLNEKTTLEELVQICEEVDQLKTQLMMFNDTLELPSDVSYSELNHSGPSQQITECDCFDSGLTVHWKKDCPKIKRLKKNGKSKKHDCFRKKRIYTKRFSANSKTKCVSETTTPPVCDGIVQDCSCFDYGLTLHWRNDCPKYKRSDFAKIQSLQDFEKTLEERAVSEKSRETTAREYLDDDGANVVINKYNVIPSISNSISNTVLKSIVSTPSCSSSTYLTSSSVGSSSSFHNGSSSLSQPIPLTFGNVKSKKSINDNITNSNKKFKKIIFIGNKSGVTPTSLASLKISTFKHSTFGKKNNNIQNIDSNKVYGNNINDNNTKVIEKDDTRLDVRKEHEDSMLSNEEKLNENKMLFYKRFYAKQKNDSKMMESLKESVVWKNS